MSIFDKILGSGSNSFGVHPSIPEDRVRRMLSVGFVIFSVILAVALVYLAIAAVSDLPPFTKRVVESLPPGDLSAIVRYEFKLKKPDFTVSECEDTAISCVPVSHYDLCTYFRYGVVVLDSAHAQPVSETFFTDWSPLSADGNKPQLVSVSAEIPHIFYNIDGGVREYLFTLVKEVGQTSKVPDSMATPVCPVTPDTIGNSVVIVLAKRSSFGQSLSGGLPPSYTLSYTDRPNDVNTWPDLNQL